MLFIIGVVNIKLDFVVELAMYTIKMPTIMKFLLYPLWNIVRDALLVLQWRLD